MPRCFCFFSSHVSFSDIQTHRRRCISSSRRKLPLLVSLILPSNSPNSLKYDVRRSPILPTTGTSTIIRNGDTRLVRHVNFRGLP
jgi:hypothetical protein